MPVHAAAYYASVNGSAAYAALTALNDPFFSVSGTTHTPPRGQARCARIPGAEKQRARQ
jgi:hypothetical protein